MSAITIRQAVLSDIEALAILFDEYRQFYGSTSDVGAARNFLMDRFNHGESVLFIAYEDETPVGFAQLYPVFSSVALVRTFVLNDILVRAPWRRCGVATRLMKAAEVFAKSLGAARLSLSTSTRNVEAQAVYQSAGWKRDEQFYVYHLALK